MLWVLKRTVSMCNQNLFFSFLNQNICCGYSKELSQCVIKIQFSHFSPEIYVPKYMLWVLKRNVSVFKKIQFSHFSPETYVVGTQKNRLSV